MRCKPNLLAAIEGTPLGRYTTVRPVVGTVTIVVFVLERQEDVALLAVVVLSSSVRVDVNDDATFGGGPLVGVLVDGRQLLEILRVLGLRHRLGDPRAVFMVVEGTHRRPVAKDENNLR
jgi:hypothetical protein